jgi:dipeptidyl-peptidase-4
MTIAASDDRRFLALDARTRHFSLGAPRSFTVVAEQSRIFFLRSKGPFDRTLHLWSIDLDGSEASERLIVDVDDLSNDVSDIPEAERQRRERMRESSFGITAYNLDGSGRWAVFSLAGALYLADTTSDAPPTLLSDDEGVVDPRINSTGERVAYLSGDALRVVHRDTREVTTVATGTETRTVGLANYVAAEEFDRTRGHWWSPCGQYLAFEEVDSSVLETFFLFDPKTPMAAPASRRYPQAGTANPVLRMGLWSVEAPLQYVTLPFDQYEYLVTVSWAKGRGLLVTLMTRDHRDQEVFGISPTNGAVTSLFSDHNDTFLEWIGGLPTCTPDGRLLVGVVDAGCDTYRVATVVDGVATAFSPVGLQVSAVVGVTNESLLAVATNDPTSVVSARINFDGTAEVAGGPASQVRALDGTPGGLIVSALTTIDELDTTYVVRVPNREPVLVPSFALTAKDCVPPVMPRVQLRIVGEHELAVAVLLPSSRTEDTKGLPIILSPYGGPHFQLVVGAGRAYAMDQFIADQGYCVIVADGRGTGGRGPAWDRSIVNELGTLPVEDQVAALEAVCTELGDLVDPNRVGIRGWSFGGYLAARAVLERPDVFHAAVAGAPVTDFGLYDTGYTERYLGHPETNSAAYDKANLVPLAGQLRHPLLFIHGYNDDNVYFAHTQVLSDALLAAGKSHQVLGLSGVTHMPTDPVIATNMVQMELDFFADALRR